MIGSSGHARGLNCATQAGLGTQRPSQSQQLCKRWPVEAGEHVESQPLRQHWHVEVVDQLDVDWEDDGDLLSSPMGQSAGQLLQHQEEDLNEAGIGEIFCRNVTWMVNGLPVKTLMVRSLPAGVTQGEILRCLPEPSVAKFNLLHVPRKVKGARSMAFAVLNFEKPEYAIAFYCKWHGRAIQIPMGNIVHSSVIQIEAARQQGFVANVLRWRTTMRGQSNPSRLPAVFICGQRKDFWQHVQSM